MQQKFVLRAESPGEEAFYSKELAGVVYTVDHVLDAELLEDRSSAEALCAFLNEVTEMEFKVCLVSVKCVPVVGGKVKPIRTEEVLEEITDIQSEVPRDFSDFREDVPLVDDQMEA